MYTKNELRAYHCPRWNELPDIQLYMDQVVGFVEKNAAPFVEDKSQKIITKTMINNYVKQKKVEPPKNKRYNRRHLAFFMVVSILKRFMSLTEIGEGIKKVRAVFDSAQAYDMFCDILEQSIAHVFDDDGEDIKITELPEHIGIIHFVTRAFANMLYARCMLAEEDTQTDETDK